jgi:hypothetical protein
VDHDVPKNWVNFSHNSTVVVVRLRQGTQFWQFQGPLACSLLCGLLAAAQIGIQFAKIFLAVEYLD